MKIKNSGLDEMQKDKRNSIGNQMFMLMFYALLLDSSLYGAGIRWLNYPANTMVIIMACMGIYLVRIIASNAYLPPKAQGRATLKFLVVAVVLSVMLAAAAFHLFGNGPAQAVDENDNTALILFLVSGVGLLISLLVAVIKKANDKKDSDE